MYENIWPDWVVKQNLIEKAQGLLGKMYDLLINKHGITADQAFGIYDMKDKGHISVADFSRIIKIFFNDILVD